MIVAITKEQAALGRQLRDTWIARGRSIGKVDHDRVERGVVAAYGAAKLKPVPVRWFPSPIKALSAAAQMVKAGAKPVVGDLFTKPLEVSRKIRENQIDERVRAVVARELHDPVNTATRSISGGVAAEMSIRALVIGDRYKSTGQMLQKIISDMSLCDQKLGVLASVAFDRVIGVAKAETWAGLIHANEAGWLFPFSNVVIATERPTRISFDADGEPHSAQGMAIEYPDGYGVFCWHGTIVPHEAVAGKVEWGDVTRAADKNVQKAVVEMTAEKWSKKEDKKPDETEEERYEAAMAVQRLGGIAAVGELLEEEKG